jgi:EpsI family protein
MQLGAWQGERIFLDEKLVEEGLWSDDYVNGRYTKEGSPNQIYLLIPFYAWQGTKHTVHAPQACLLGGGYSIVEEQIHRIQVTPDRAIDIKALLLAKGDQKMLATHIFLQRGRVLTSPWTNKFYLMYDSMTKRRTDGALVRVELVMSPNQSMEDGLSMIDDFYQQLWPLLPAYVPF